MKVQRKLGLNTIVEADGDTVAEVFEDLALLEWVFSHPRVCGLCREEGRDFLRPRKTGQGKKYHKCVCVGCGAEFRFGVRTCRPGVLFPQLKDAEGRDKPNGGWSKWTPNG